jgi:Subtilase family
MVMACRGLIRTAAILLLCTVAATGARAASARPSGTLDWQARRNRVDARIESWSLPALLAAIESASGWQVYVEPGTELEVTARFEGLSQADALRRLLGRLNFALLPQVDGPAKLFVFRTSAEGATERVRAAATGGSPGRAGTPIRGERIVVLAPGSDADDLARRLGATIVGRLAQLRAYRLAFGSEGRARSADRALARDPAVESVEANLAFAPPEILEPLAAAAQPSFALRPDMSPSTDRVVVGLIDTAVQEQGARLADFLQPAVSVVGDYRAPDGPLTHGTAMAATIVDGVARGLLEAGDTSGMAPLSILPVDVYGASETTNTFDLARGIYEALDRHVNVVNLSLTTDGDSQLVRTLIDDAAKRGVLVFGAAGNDGGTTRVYPAGDRGVVSVTAADARGGVASWANSGSWVDAMAPGENVISYQDQAWYGTGTSFATSLVSGWAAGAMAGTRRSPTQVERETLARWGVAQDR